jgi:hypothetical protein
MGRGSTSRWQSAKPSQQAHQPRRPSQPSTAARAHQHGHENGAVGGGGDELGRPLAAGGQVLEVHERLQARRRQRRVEDRRREVLGTLVGAGVADERAARQRLGIGAWRRRRWRRRRRHHAGAVGGPGWWPTFLLARNTSDTRVTGRRGLARGVGAGSWGDLLALRDGCERVQASGEGFESVSPRGPQACRLRTGGNRARPPHTY